MSGLRREAWTPGALGRAPRRWQRPLGAGPGRRGARGGGRGHRWAPVQGAAGTVVPGAGGLAGGPAVRAGFMRTGGSLPLATGLRHVTGSLTVVPSYADVGYGGPGPGLQESL